MQYTKIDRELHFFGTALHYPSYPVDYHFNILNDFAVTLINQEVV